MFQGIKKGMKRTRERFSERMNVLFDRGPNVDEDFWDGLEEALIESDVGARTADEIVENMRTQSTRKAMTDGYEVMDALVDEIAHQFAHEEMNIFDENPVTVVFVGVNGAGKTTTCGKIAAAEKDAGRHVLMGNADTFRAAAREQLDIWGKRSGVSVVERDRGADPASVCYDTLEEAEKAHADMVLIDTAGRLHTSSDLMRELKKVVNVVRKRSKFPVKVVLVLDATTGQNGITQAQEFNRALSLDGIIVTKLDGTARGGIALNVSSELGLPIAKVGVGEQVGDLQDFDPEEYAAALIGAEPQENVDTTQEPNPARQADEMARHGADVEVADNETNNTTNEFENAVGKPEKPGSEPKDTLPTSEPEETSTDVSDAHQEPSQESVEESSTEKSGADTSNEDAFDEDTSSDKESRPKKKRFKRLFKWRRRKDK